MLEWVWAQSGEASSLRYRPVVVPTADVGVEEWQAGEAADSVDTGKAELGSQKSWVNHTWVVLMHSEELPG